MIRVNHLMNMTSVPGHLQRTGYEVLS